MATRADPGPAAAASQSEQSGRGRFAGATRTSRMPARGVSVRIPERFRSTNANPCLRAEHACGDLQRRSRTDWPAQRVPERNRPRRRRSAVVPLGDAVDGVSAARAELIIACVRATDEACAVKLAGNHEAWALQDRSLPDAAATLLASWSVAAQHEGILAVHGSPDSPLMGRISDEHDARDALRRLRGWLCVHGHTHQAALWVQRSDGTTERQRRPTSHLLGRSMRALACPGAVSGPDPCWLLVDTVLRRLSWHPVTPCWSAPAPIANGTASRQRTPSAR